MAQHDYVIANQGFPAFRSDLNDALAAIVSNNSGATEPTTMFAHQMWVDTAADPSVLKIRNADNDAWITIGTINQTSDAFKLTPADGVSTNTIAELTSGSGVTIDGVLLKDGLVNTLTVGRGAGDVSSNTAVGASALAANEAGVPNNTAIGYQALDANTTGDSNTALGSNALGANTTATNNVAVGAGALTTNTTASNNTAVGHSALELNETGTGLVAMGFQALEANTTGGSNTAVGWRALQSNTTASSNTAVGYQAGYSLTTNGGLVAIGYQAAYATTEGTLTAVGDRALDANTTGYYLVGVGSSALGANTSGIGNTAIGYIAGNTITTGQQNTCVGYDAQNSSASASFEFTLGNGNTNNLRCNDTSISSLSDARDKTNVADIPLGLDFVNQMRPVSFDWNRRDGTYVGRKAFGFIAQELKVIADASGYADHLRLVHEDNSEKLEADPMKTYPVLIKAIQELSAQVTALQAEVNALKGQ